MRGKRRDDERVVELSPSSSPKSKSSGLNLLCASRVFFMEPLVNHAFELQAIARVSRIGATRWVSLSIPISCLLQTIRALINSLLFHYRVSHIYCLYVKDTVEERILNLAAKRKRSLYLKNGNEEQINSSILTSRVEKINLHLLSRSLMLKEISFQMTRIYLLVFWW